jgi:glycosyltransferase involved in cell wall biosynthesis
MLARALAELGPVDLVATRSADEDPATIVAGLPFVDRVRLPILSRPRAAIRTAGAVWRGGLLQQALYAEPEAVAATAELAADADVVIAHLVRTLPWLPRVRPPLIVDIQDALSAQYRWAAGRAHGWRGAAARVESKRIDAAERAAVLEADVVSFISSRDRDLVLRGHSEAVRSVIVAAALDPDRWPRTEVPAPRSGVVFAGNLRTASNRAMVELLALRVWPIVRSVHRSAELRIVGVEASDAVRALGRRPGVTFVGPVEDMGRALAGAVATACPLEFGSGVQNKVLESLAMETPVVLTPRAAEALCTSGGAGTGMKVARLRRPFAERLVKLLADPQHAARVGAEGREWVLARHRPEVALAALKATVRELAGAPG